MSVLEEAFRRATKNLNFANRRDRVRGFYVRRRALQLLNQNSGWDADTLALQLVREQAAIMAYVTQTMAALLQGPDPKGPQHLDLEDAAKLFDSGSSGHAALQISLKANYRVNRSDWIWQIVWRAVAIHDDMLWKKPITNSELESVALDELVDRRLRAVEHMHCNVNSGGVGLSTSSQVRSWVVKGPNGPWTDGIVVRNFEYPFLPKAPFKDVLATMTNWRDSGSTILFDPPLPQAPIRLPKRVSDSWLMLVDAADNLWPTFRPDASISHTETFRRMFSKPRDSFFDRNWLYCDQVGSAVTIEALEFAIQRRPGDHTQFDNAMTNPNYVKLGPVVRRPVVRRPKSRIQEKEEANSDILMSDDNDSFFDNTFVAIEDLQVGDFTCFWNNRLYDLLGSGAWRNEYCLIMGVDSSEIDGKVRNSGGPQVWLAGHGVATTLYNAMATELIGNIKVLLESLRRDLVAALANNAAIPATRSGQLLVRWSPYEEFDPPGAWWIKIPKDTWNKKWRFQSLEEAVQAVLPTVAMSTPVGQGYNPPPEADALYFPLYEPQVTYQYSEGDSWHGYLQKRMSDAKFRAPTALRALTADTRLAPGLYYRGENAKIPVVRPKVRK